MIKTFFALFLISSMGHAFAMVVVKGTVQSFDNQKIILKNSGNTLVIPRSAYPDLKKVVLGHSVIEVHVTPKEMHDLNPKFPRK